MNALDRPEQLAGEVWYHDRNRTVCYIEIAGQTPEMTNHLSIIDFEVLHGAGRLATRSSIIELQPGTRLHVRRGEPYKWGGQVSALVTMRPGLIQGFVTYNGEKLEPKYQKILKKARREVAVADMLMQLSQEIGPPLNVLAAFQQGLDSNRPALG